MNWHLIDFASVCKYLICIIFVVILFTFHLNSAQKSDVLYDYVLGPPLDSPALSSTIKLTSPPIRLRSDGKCFLFPFTVTSKYRVFIFYLSISRLCVYPFYFVSFCVVTFSSFPFYSIYDELCWFWTSTFPINIQLKLTNKCKPNTLDTQMPITEIV